MRAVDKARREAFAICTAITSDIINTAAHEESLDKVMDSFKDIFPADSPGLHLYTFFKELTTEPMDLSSAALPPHPSHCTCTSPHPCHGHT